MSDDEIVAMKEIRWFLWITMIHWLFEQDRDVDFIFLDEDIENPSTDANNFENRKERIHIETNIQHMTVQL
jgi:hypothetical protein